MQTSEIINIGSKALKNRNINSHRIDSEIILSHVLKISREKLLISESDVSKEDLEKFRSLIFRRLCNEPIAYIINKKEFRSEDFFVDNSSLIPRPETELLIDPIIKLFKKKSLFFLDIGVGTGCIMFSILRELNHSRGIGIDICKKAISNAKINLYKLKIENRAKLLCKPVGQIFNQKFDLIVSNPPYISTKERKSLPPEVINFDPEGSLFCGPDGLHVCKSIIDKAPNYLNKNGWLLIEYGFCQKDNVSNLFSSDWTNVKQRKPWGAPRSEKDFFVEAQWSPS